MLLRKEIKKALPAALTVVGLLLVFNLRVLSNNDWNPRAFILERPEENPLSQGYDIGYDAQWYYAIALDPLGAAPGLDQAAYRYQRIVFPLTVAVFSLGIPVLVPWMMITVNLFATFVVMVSMGILLRNRGVSPWVALVLPFSAGYLVTIRMDLLEPLALALALTGWVAFERKNFRAAILLFALGGLTKEFALVFPAAAAAALLVDRQWKNGIGVAAGSVLPYILWGVFLTAVLGTSNKALAQATPQFIPFFGLRALTDPVSRFVAVLWVIAPTVLVLIILLIDLLKSKFNELRAPEVVLVLAWCGFISIMPELTWADPLAVLRVGTGLTAAALIWLAYAHKRLLPAALGLWLPSILILFIVPGFV